MTDPTAPLPGPAEYRSPAMPPMPPAPTQPEDPTPRRRNPLTSKPVIGVAALVVGIALGAAGGGGNASTDATAALPAPAPTVTVTTTATATPAAPASTEPEESATPTPTTEPTQAPAAEDTSYKWGKKGEFTYEDVHISLKVDAPKPSANTFDKDNLEAKLTVCNLGSDTIEELSAEGLGLYAEDKNGGQYSLYGAYRSPEFPTYSWDSAALKAGKCRTGWVSFEDGRKAIRIATDIGDTTYSWSKNGK